MKTTFKAGISIIAAILFGCFMWYAYTIYTGQNETSFITELYQDRMTAAKVMLTEKDKAIQYAALALRDKNGMSILRSDEGVPYLETEEGPVPLAGNIDEETYGYIEDIMGKYEAGGVLYNIKVTSEAVLFYTDYLSTGSIGFLYDKDPDKAKEYEVIKMAPNWNIFYTLKDT